MQFSHVFHLGVGKNPPNPKTRSSLSGFCVYFHRFGLETPKPILVREGFKFIKFSCLNLLLNLNNLETLEPHHLRILTLIFEQSPSVQTILTLELSPLTLSHRRLSPTHLSSLLNPHDPPLLSRRSLSLSPLISLSRPVAPLCLLLWFDFLVILFC